MESAYSKRASVFIRTKSVYDLQLLFHFPTIASTNTKFHFLQKITRLFYLCLYFLIPDYFLIPNLPTTKRIAFLSSKLLSY